MKKNQNIDALINNSKSDFKNTLNPYLKTRIFAELDQTYNTDQSFSFMNYLKKPIAIFLQGAVVASLLIFSYSKVQNSLNKSFQGTVGQVYSINIELAKMKSKNITWVKISLPKNISLFSKSNNSSDVKQARFVTIPLSSIDYLKYLPVVFKSNKQGRSVIKVSFLNSNRKILNTKLIKLNFTNHKVLTF